MTLSAGTRLGPYKITGALGAGGMGEVYRSRDTTLNREVAIKVLPEAMAGDAERLARFKREAQVLASLNHSNIAHVYGFESANLPDSSTVHFLAMELVPGEDLSGRLKRGAIPVDEALGIASQIAEALEPGVPVLLFPTRIAGGGSAIRQGRQYDVAKDGRFLINTVIDDTTAPITLVLNGRPDKP